MFNEKINIFTVGVKIIFYLYPMSLMFWRFQTIRFVQMKSLTFDLFTLVSYSGPRDPLV